VTRINFPRLQPLLETVRVLQQKGLTGEGILQTIFSHGVQLRCQREVAMGSSPRLPLLFPAGCYMHWPPSPRNSGLWGHGGSRGTPRLLQVAAAVEAEAVGGE
jgi:hypothetical protein